MMSYLKLLILFYIDHKYPLLKLIIFKSIKITIDDSKVFSQIFSTLAYSLLSQIVFFKKLL